MLHKNKGNPSKPTPKEREKMIKQNWNKKKKLETKYFEAI
jgi:hypothetical protein